MTTNPDDAALIADLQKYDADLQGCVYECYVIHASDPEGKLWGRAAARIEALLAENAALLRELSRERPMLAEGCVTGPISVRRSNGIVERLDDVLVERDAALADAEALRKDAERYRWLRKAWIVCKQGTCRGIWMNLDVAAMRSNDMGPDDAFDAAIDSARASAPAQGEGK